MYLNIGQNVLVPEKDVIGIFDLDNTSWCIRTREFLDRAERLGQVTALGEDLPRSFVLCRTGGGPAAVYLTTLTSSALRGRAEANAVSALDLNPGRNS